jgi:hypothetical protein
VSNSVVEPSCIWRENAAHPRGKWLPGTKLNVNVNRLTAKTTCTGSSIASCKSDAVLFSVKSSAAWSAKAAAFGIFSEIEGVLYRTVPHHELHARKTRREVSVCSMGPTISTN